MAQPDEASPLSDPNNVELVEVAEGDAYRSGMTVEDAYRYLANAPRVPIETARIELG